MILGEGSRTAGTAATLDDLFRRAGVRHPDAIALADPPNRAKFTDGAPRTLSFAQADRAIAAFAAKLRGLGLQTDTSWRSSFRIRSRASLRSLASSRRHDCRSGTAALAPARYGAALGHIGAKAIVTSSRIGTTAHAEIATQTAVELFPIRHVCGFGPNLPDGVAPLDDVFSFGGADVSAPRTRPGPAAAHIGAITFGLDAKGRMPVARSHVELVAGRPGDLSGNRCRAGDSAAVDNSDRFICRDRPHGDAVAVVGRHTAPASRF